MCERQLWVLLAVAPTNVKTIDAILYNRRRGTSMMSTHAALIQRTGPYQN